ncbi:MAG: acyl-CoA dehydrogenase [Deltaproteobacteria bacterium]|nr:acyl-CoA dehydrogenase [Deltaproteobacteria bacterium]
MNFDLTDDQRMLVDTARGFVKKSSPVDRFRKQRSGELGFDRKVWEQMGELGWLGVMYPEEIGGFGGRFIDAALIIEQLATTLVPEPYLASAIAGGLPILRGGSAEQRKRWLPDLIEGKAIIALANSEDGSRYATEELATRANESGSSFRIDGKKRWVLAGHAADRFVVSARTDDGVSLFVVERDAKGVAVDRVKTMDGHGAAMLSLEGVEVGADAMLGEQGQGAAILDQTCDAAAAAACIEAVGLAQTVLNMTVEYMKTREQFGVKIGSFQALQHRAVDMFVEIELLRSLAIEASLRIDEGEPDDRRAAVSAAKVQLAAGGRQVVRQGTQLHGGIGVTEEHDIGLYFKRMQVLSALFGDDRHHLRRFASLPGFAAGVETSS